MSKANLPLAFDMSTLSNYSRKKLGCRQSLYEPIGGIFMAIA
jgi:hypothetical protein